jgi:hypothetical protein
MRRRTALAILAGLALLVAAWWLLGRRSQPQMGSSQEVFQSVDALFTAVTAKNEEWLMNCEERLRAQHEGGALSAAAWKRLERIIAQARAGQWEPAASTLYTFIEGQRREEPGGPARAAREQLPGTPARATPRVAAATRAPAR